MKCKDAVAEEVSTTDVVALLKSDLSDSGIVKALQSRTHKPFSAADIANFANERKKKTDTDFSSELASELTKGADIYIGWSVLPGKSVKDNFGHFVLGTYFALDVAISNRSADASHSVLVTVLELCNGVRNISVDPKMVKGTMTKGALTGARSRTSKSIEAIGTVLTPAAPFFKNQAHQLTFTTGLSFFNPMKTAFDTVFPDTINALYIAAWNTDDVFTQGGFVIPSGGEKRGRVFIPIEYIYPRPAKDSPCKGKDKSCESTVEYTSWTKEKRNWESARSGNYKPDEVKMAIGPLVVLGQSITVHSPVRSVSQQ